ncbi:RING/U-box superfamily protein [Quillaja saponaria]|uniref:RING/U-box superfamily protein n=1 Tax=Quillaja saponaria TaxID=32244 RepID=A0AAD7PJC0_QUISA|nr:RING/U-box superfamily protein [Quillaja saponaria]
MSLRSNFFSSPSPSLQPAAMSALSHLFSNLYSKTILLFTLLLIELILLIRSLTRLNLKSDKRPITTTQYLKLIENKYPTIYYTKKLKPKLQQLDCSVCLSEFEDGEKIRKLNCKHSFHKDCLDKWFQQYLATCPLCRNKVLPDDVVARYQLRNQVDQYDGSDEEMVFFLSAFHGRHRFHRRFF